MLAHFAWQLEQSGRSHQPYPEWVDRFARYDPWRVLFAHDVAIWERSAETATPPATPASASP